MNSENSDGQIWAEWLQILEQIWDATRCFIRDGFDRRFNSILYIYIFSKIVSDIYIIDRRHKHKSTTMNIIIIKYIIINIIMMIQNAREKYGMPWACIFFHRWPPICFYSLYLFKTQFSIFFWSSKGKCCYSAHIYFFHI